MYLWAIFIYSSSDVIAAPVDDDHPQGFAISLLHETVSDTVDQSPNLAEGGFATPVTKPRFKSDGFALSYKPDSHTRFHLLIAKRQMNSLRDSFEINGIRAGMRRRLNPSDTSWYSLGIGFDASVNFSPEIYKNSYTNYDDQLIKEVRIVQPRDARISIRADMAWALTDRLKMQFALSGGVSQTTQKEVIGTVQRDNECRYAFSASSQGGSVRQLERCGSLLSYVQKYPTNQSLIDTLGFSVTDDLSYRDYFLGPQISMRWKQGAWSLSTGYEYRQYFRPTLDRRIRQAGDVPVTRSYGGFASANVGLFTHWQLNARVMYQRAAFLDDVPFLYSAFTHERYRGNGVIRFGLTLSRFFD